MKNYLLLLFVLPGLTNIAYSQSEETEKEPFLEFAGSVDLYYKYDFSGNANIGTSFADDHNSFSIGMVNLITSKTVGKASFVADVALGPRNAASAGPSANELQPAIQNLYISYSLTDRLSVTAGYMGTFVGYEIISPVGNFNYSTSYMFTNGPFQNAGLKLAYQVNDKIGLMAGVFNDWNVYSQPSGEGINSFGGQLSLSPVEGMNIYINAITGEANGTEFDLTAGYQITDKFYMGLNAANWTYNSPDINETSEFAGVALYSQLGLTDGFSIGLRAEEFTTSLTDYIGTDGMSGLEAEDVFALTLSGNIGKGNLVFIPEIRFDKASQNVFTDKNDEATDLAAQILFAAVFSF